MKRFLVIACALAATVATIQLVHIRPIVSIAAQAAQSTNVPTIPFDTSTDFLKYSPDMNLGEVLGIAVNSKGHIVVLNHPGKCDVEPALRECLDTAPRVRSDRQVRA